MAGSGVGAMDMVEVGTCDCGFEATVDVVIDDFKIGHWDCPQCGQEQEMDWLFDPDDAYDRMRDNRDY